MSQNSNTAQADSYVSPLEADQIPSTRGQKQTDNYLSSVKSSSTTARQDRARAKQVLCLFGDSYNKISPLEGNVEQASAWQALHEKTCVVLTGKVGSGKTLLAVGAYLEMLAKGEIGYLVIARPKVPSDHGFYKGSKMDKVLETLGNMKDAFRHIFGHSYGAVLESLMCQGIVEVETLDDIKGRSFSGGALLVDESQDCFPEDMETVLTRIAEDGRVAVLGDPEQVSRKMKPLFQRADTVNGLSAALLALKPSDHIAIKTLTQIVRSPLTQEVKEGFDQFYKSQAK